MTIMTNMNTQNTDKMPMPQAIILAAGASSRFWPLSEGSHKSAIRIMGKTLLQHTIDSIASSGISDIIIIEKPDSGTSETITAPKGTRITYVTQKEPKGMGNAILQAKGMIKGTFFVFNPNHYEADKYIKIMTKETTDSDKHDKHNRHNKQSMVLLGTKTDTPEKYGIFTFDKKTGRATKITEKPKKSEAESDIRVVGIYLLPKTFLETLEKTKEHEYSFEEALSAFMKDPTNTVKVAITGNPPLSLKYPWDLLDFTKDMLDKKLKSKIETGSKPDPKATIKGAVHIGKNCTIHENAVIKGPVYIGDNCIIGNNAVVRDHTNLEDNTMIGTNAEITRSSFQRNSNMHSGFIGDSVISENTKIGAGFITGNKRLDRKEITSTVKGVRTSTKRTALGAIIGRDSRIGINSSTMPGILIGTEATIGSNTQVSENIESKTLYFTEFSAIKKKK